MGPTPERDVMRMPQVFCDECDTECTYSDGRLQCPICLAVWVIEFERVETADPELERLDRNIFTRNY